MKIHGNVEFHRAWKVVTLYIACVVCFTVCIPFLTINSVKALKETIK